MPHSDSDSMSVTTLADPLGDGKSSPSPASSGYPPASKEGSGVDVAQAELEFETLRRQLTRTSTLHRIRTGEKDPEKEDEDDFDLLAYLHQTQESYDKHGFKRKHLGVIFEGLSVTGAGGIKVRPFASAVDSAARLTTSLFSIALHPNLPRRHQGVFADACDYGHEVAFHA
jgi:hypothetical protein